MSYKPTPETIIFRNPDAPRVDGYEGMLVQYKPGTRLKGVKAVAGAHDVYEFAKSMGMLDDTRERVYAVYLDAKNKPMGYRLIGSGGTTDAFVDQKVLFGPSVALHAPSMIIVHNHPSGSYEPSAADITLTERMKKNAEILGIRLLDHIVAGRDGYFGILSNQGADIERVPVETAANPGRKYEVQPKGPFSGADPGDLFIALLGAASAGGWFTRDYWDDDDKIMHLPKDLPRAYAIEEVMENDVASALDDISRLTRIPYDHVMPLLNEVYSDEIVEIGKSYERW